MEKPESAPADPLSGPILTERGENPWSGFTSTAEEEEASKRVSSVWPFPPGYESLPALAAFDKPGDPLLARSQGERRVLANSRWLSDIHRADATGPEAEETPVLIWKDLSFARLSLQELVLFLIKSQILRTYWHVEGRMSLESIREEGSSRHFIFSGEHIYFTNERNISPLRFRVRVDLSTGGVFLGRP